MAFFKVVEGIINEGKAQQQLISWDETDIT
jgi:hypothetical protein